MKILKFIVAAAIVIPYYLAAEGYYALRTIWREVNS